MNGRQNGSSWLSLGTAGAIGAAAMYGMSRINRNGGAKQMAERARNSQPVQNMQNTLPNFGGK
ncbi:hypothetical protein [Halobacillus litoralis]|uniref:Uncharacterized protein n=1 Tax=Halobacillus litoralis TaxID=45668 RepID=A0A410MC85_9BACI|nr:hypothetical protein [Halobacillus litoralis]QAS52266.1 hypothetical protein HLI_08490 [Halobacillus litoralis]